jgi:hypothetical protein
MSASPLTLPKLKLQFVANLLTGRRQVSSSAPLREAGLVHQPGLHLVPSQAPAVDVTVRKGPVGLVASHRQTHTLRLVQACAEPTPLEQSTVQRHLEPGLAFYRIYTESLLSRYMKMSMEHGRVSSLLGRELFRGNVSCCKVEGFDDAVIFVHDVGRCLEQLSPGLRHLVRRIALEQYTQAEAAAMLGISMRTVTRRYSEALDKLTRLFLERGLLKSMMGEVDLNQIEG